MPARTTIRTLAARLIRTFAPPHEHSRIAPRLGCEMLEDRTQPSNLNLSAAAYPSHTTLGQFTAILGSVTSTEPMGSLSMGFDWGDGYSVSHSYSFDPAATNWVVESGHKFSAVGTYSVTASAGYSSGGTDTATESYTVTVTDGTSPPPPPPTMAEDAVVQIITHRDASEAGPAGLFQLLRSGGDLTQPLTVNYLVSGSATQLLDYNALSGSVVFAANAYTATISLTALPDLLVEGNETVTATLSNGPGYTVVTPAGTQTLVIIDDPTLVTIGPASKLLPEGSDGTITLSRSGGDLTRPLTVAVTIGADSQGDPLATFNADYALTGVSGGGFGTSLVTVTFGANQADVSVGVSIADDGLTEGKEGFQLALQTDGLNYLIGVDGTGGVGSTADVQIADDSKARQIVMTDKTGATVGPGGLRVAKWHDAFEMATDNKSVQIKWPDANNWDFIDRDPDRFNVWVFDKAAWDAKDSNGTAVIPHIRVKISTDNVAGFTDYNDNPTEVDLVRYVGAATGPATGSGWFWSDSQTLVSNVKDDEYKASGYLQEDNVGPGADGLFTKNGYTWKVSDRTHLVALRGTVKAEYTGGGVTINTTAPVPVRNVVKVHPIILRDKKEVDGGNPVITVADANTAIHKGNEQYAQVGILLLPSTPDIVDPPTGVDLVNGLDEFPGLRYNVIQMTNEEKALLGEAKYRTDATNDVELYFVNYLSNKSRGEAFPADNVPDQKYADSAVISVRESTSVSDPFTIPHELAHVVLNAKHYTATLWPANLLRAAPSLTDSETASKRFTPDQDNDAHTKRPNLLTNP